MHDLASFYDVFDKMVVAGKLVDQVLPSERKGNFQNIHQGLTYIHQGQHPADNIHQGQHWG